ncbi:hypothetical protein KAR48_14890 [bacterium]|nr:hypothetical protein [bacterium]
MTDQQIQQDLTLIKQMIEKTRRDTAQSGYFFIFIGIISLLGTVAIAILENLDLKQWTTPTLILMTVANAVIGYRIGARESQKVKTYAKIVFWHVWMACGFTALLIVFFFPAVHLYPMTAVPILVSMLMGIGLYVTGILLELRFMQWSSAAWWIGACLMAVIKGPYQTVIMVAVILLGWILPGYILNKQYRRRSTP